MPVLREEARKAVVFLLGISGIVVGSAHLLAPSPKFPVRYLGAPAIVQVTSGGSPCKQVQASSDEEQSYECPLDGRENRVTVRCSGLELPDAQVVFRSVDPYWDMVTFRDVCSATKEEILAENTRVEGRFHSWEVGGPKPTDWTSGSQSCPKPEP